MYFILMFITAMTFANLNAVVDNNGFIVENGPGGKICVE